MSFKLVPTSSNLIGELTQSREGETRVGEIISPLSGKDITTELEQAKESGAVFAILGIPEDIGPRANLGRAGSSGAWRTFLKAFLNNRQTKLHDLSSTVIVGTVDVSDLQQQSQSADLNQLRDLCSSLDDRVESIVSEIISADLIPIIIGGGHNNSYPILKAISRAKNSPLGCINFDPHADFRQLEGRHSGNGFSYAHAEGFLKNYYVIGLDLAANSQHVLDAISEAGFCFSSYQELKVERSRTLQAAISDAIFHVSTNNLAAGIEVDLDSISFMPSSAERPNGFETDEAAHFVFTAAQQLPNPAYLHLPEGAPELANSPATGERDVGRALSLLVDAFISGYHNR